MGERRKNIQWGGGPGDVPLSGEGERKSKKHIRGPKGTRIV